MFYRPAEGHGLPHNPFTALVSPRPIAWISTRDKDGRPNLAPYSFFNAVSERPPIIAFSSDGMKDTLRNILETGVFTVNMASSDHAVLLNLTSAPFPHGTSEFAQAGIEMADGISVPVPRVASAPCSLECQLLDHHKIKTLDGSHASNIYVLGQVTGIHIDDSYINNGHVDMVKAGLLSRLGYRDFSHVDSSFQMMRPEVRKDR